MLVRYIEYDLETGDIKGHCDTDDTTVNQEWLNKPNIKAFPAGTIRTGMKIDVETGELVVAPISEPTDLEVLIEEINNNPVSFIKKFQDEKTKQEIITILDSVAITEQEEAKYSQNFKKSE